MKKLIVILSVMTALVSLIVIAKFTGKHFISQKKIVPPKGWVSYTNKVGRYSLNYPNEWSLTECGKGEIVLSVSPVNKCYMPLEAPEEYLEKLHLQVFVLLGRESILIPSDSTHKILQSWRSVTWDPVDNAFSVDSVLFDVTRYRLIWSKSVPINSTSKQALGYDQFRVGLIEKPDYLEQYKQVLNSVRRN